MIYPLFRFARVLIILHQSGDGRAPGAEVLGFGLESARLDENQ
ncbi:MAG: hypothetical protein ABI162_12535 [Luteolibacter sp.]